MLQRVLPKRLRARVLYLAQYPRLAGHPSDARMYYTLRREYYWPKTANEVFLVPLNRQFCPGMIAIFWKHQRELKLFPAVRSPEFVAKELLRPLLKTQRGHQFVLVITDLISKYFCFVPLQTNRTTVVANAILDHWVYASGALGYLLTDNVR